jgi:hypothetical protein
MMITALDGDDPADLLEWADTYGLTHPVVGDGAGEFYWAYGDGAWPMPVLIDRGMVLSSVNNGGSEASAIEALLYPE